MDSGWAAVAAFATIFLIVEALYLFVLRPASRTKEINRRLAITAVKKTQDQVFEQLRRERWLPMQGGRMRFLRRLVVQSGIKVEPFRLGVAALFVSFTVLFFAGLLLGFNAFSFTLTAILVPAIGIIYLSIKRARRQASFGEQLPDAVDIMVRSLRAGHPVPRSLALVAGEMSDPAGTEFGIASDELTYGSDLPTAVDALSERVGHQDLKFLVVALSIQSATGGNLSEILSNLSTVIRQRFKLRRKVKALSAEGRYSAVLLSLMPFILFGGMNVLMPRYYGDIWGHPALIPAFATAGLVMLLGFFIMYRMVNFKV
jgi:tight adherence protein B